MDVSADLKSPLGIAVLMIVSSIGGGWIRDRLSTETRDTSSAVKVEELDRRLTEHLTDAVSRRQFEEMMAEQTKRLDDMRDDIRETKREVERVLVARSQK